jgi:hypothetical protein
MKTRAEHLAWCKQRALNELRDDTQVQIAAAWGSMVSDLSKHPETNGHMAIALGSILFITGNLSTKDQMAKFITDFN